MVYSTTQNFLNLSFNIQNENFSKDSSSEDPNLLEINTVATRMMEWQRQEYQLAYGKEYTEYFKENTQKEKYLKLETAFRNPHLPEEWDSYEPAGGIKLSSNPEHVEAFVQKKFRALRQEGLLLYRSEFKQRENPQTFRRPGVQHTDAPTKCVDLTRLWGAEFLREKLVKNKTYHVPRFLLVLEDHVTTLPVRVQKDKKSLVISSCDPSKGELFVQEVIGKASCTSEKHGWMRELGYVDYADSGNIRETSDGHFHVVDTEWKSLDGVVDLIDPHLTSENPSIKILRKYASDRFDVFYSEEWVKVVPVFIKE